MWDNPTLFNLVKAIENNIEKREVLKKSIEKILLIDPLTTNNVKYQGSLVLSH